jgi:hypothetical protein
MKHLIFSLFMVIVWYSFGATATDMPKFYYAEREKCLDRISEDIKFFEKVDYTKLMINEVNSFSSAYHACSLYFQDKNTFILYREVGNHISKLSNLLQLGVDGQIDEMNIMDVKLYILTAFDDLQKNVNRSNKK